jgi:hypothetical protein
VIDKDKGHALKKASLKLFWSILIAATVLLFAYQNCSPIHLAYKEPSIIPNKLTNGGPYGGMAKVYRHFNVVQPCSAKDLKGQPLANTEILFKPNDEGLTAPYLARESCSDLRIPTSIAAADLQILDPSLQTVRYKNTDLSSQNPPGDFDIVAAQCPIGKSEISGALRTNSFVHSLDWMLLQDPAAIGPDYRFQSNGAARGWNTFPGIGVGLFSTIQSLPAFVVERNDSSNLELWRRQSQFVQLKANSEYMFSFVAQAGTVNGADVHIYRGMAATPGPTDESVLVTFDFNAGTTNVQYALNVAGVSATLTPFGTGYLCTLYFKSSSTADQFVTNIGVTPTTSGQALGQWKDSIVATAAQLVEVNSVCR